MSHIGVVLVNLGRPFAALHRHVIGPGYSTDTMMRLESGTTIRYAATNIPNPAAHFMPLGKARTQLAKRALHLLLCPIARYLGSPALAHAR